MVATDHMWLLNNLNVASAPRSQIFNFYLILFFAFIYKFFAFIIIFNFNLINCDVAMAAMLDSTALEILWLSDATSTVNTLKGRCLKNLS